MLDECGKFARARHRQQRHLFLHVAAHLADERLQVAFEQFEEIRIARSVGQDLLQVLQRFELLAFARLVIGRDEMQGNQYDDEAVLDLGITKARAAAMAKDEAVTPFPLDEDDR